MWRAIETCGSQVRAIDGGAYAWDFSAVMTVASALGADLGLLADLLGDIEPCVLMAWRRES